MGHGLRRVVVVADAGPEAGLGHLSRSSALAVALECKGFLPRCLANGAAAPIDRDGVHWDPLPEQDSVEEIPADAVVVLDSYRIPAESLDCSLLIVLQEHTAAPPGAALVVNAGADPAESGPVRLSGFAYACLRPAFWGLPRREVADRVERVLVTTGAADAGNVAVSLAEAARGAAPEARVALVRGPYAPTPVVDGISVIEGRHSLLPLLLESDLVITAGGQTMLEGAATGAPCVVVPQADNQQEQAARLSGLGAVLLASLEEIRTAAAELASNVEARRQVAARAQEVVDGYGALRVAHRIAALAGALGFGHQRG